ncbi:DUF723 domain-containing protein [Brytella acorum]|uniref:DUF723 domain-containing protein n=1 Tax=Brytella acorum TaxID=2959299 RepID=UPI003743E551
MVKDVESSKKNREAKRLARSSNFPTTLLTDFSRRRRPFRIKQPVHGIPTIRSFSPILDA